MYSIRYLMLTNAFSLIRKAEINKLESLIEKECLIPKDMVTDVVSV